MLAQIQFEPGAVSDWNHIREVVKLHFALVDWSFGITRNNAKVATAR